MAEKEPGLSNSPERHPSRAEYWLHFFETRYWLRDLILAVLLSFIVIVFLYQPVQVEGTSMMPEVTNHQRIFINKFIYHFEPIQRGDIVVFLYPGDRTKSYIKRVVGLPGEWVALRDGRLYINGEPHPETYIPPEYFDHQDYGPFHVETNHYFVLGDHREASNDSRSWGTVDRGDIYGKAVFVYWPLNEIGLLK